MSYTDGQCTAWVHFLSPWTGATWGDAHSWAAAAAAAGFDTSHVSSVGSVAVWPANYGGALADGHVAVVTAIDPHGNVTVSEENWTNGPFHSDSRVITAAIADGLTYIAPPARSAALAATISENQPMTASERLEVSRAITDLCYWSIGHRPPDSPQTRDTWAQQGVVGGFPQLVEAMANSPEFTQIEHKDAQRDS